MNNNQQLEHLAQHLHHSLNDVQHSRDYYERRRCLRSVERVVSNLIQELSNLAQQEPSLNRDNRDSTITRGTHTNSSENNKDGLMVEFNEAYLLNPKEEICNNIISDLVSILVLPIELISDASAVQTLESTVHILTNFVQLPLLSEHLDSILDSIGKLGVAQIRNTHQNHRSSSALSAVIAIGVTSLTCSQEILQEDGVALKSFGDTIKLAEVLINVMLLHLPNSRWKPLLNLTDFEEQEKVTLFDMGVLLNFLFVHAVNLQEDEHVNEEEVQALLDTKTDVESFLTESIEYIIDAFDQSGPSFEVQRKLPQDEINQENTLSELILISEDIIRHTGIVIHLIETLLLLNILQISPRIASFYVHIYRFMSRISATCYSNDITGQHVLQSMVSDLESRLTRLVSEVPDNIDRRCKCIAFFFSVSKSGFNFTEDNESLLNALITCHKDDSNDNLDSKSDKVSCPIEKEHGSCNCEGISAAQAAIMSSILYRRTLNDPVQDSNVNVIVEKIQSMSKNTQIDNPWECIVSKRLVQSGIYYEKKEALTAYNILS